MTIGVAMIVGWEIVGDGVCLKTVGVGVGEVVGVGLNFTFEVDEGAMVADRTLGSLADDGTLSAALELAPSMYPVVGATSNAAISQAIFAPFDKELNQFFITGNICVNFYIMIG